MTATYAIRLVRTVAATASRTGYAYRCEVVDTGTGGVLYTTDRHPTARAAWRDASEWCDQFLGQGQ